MVRCVSRDELAMQNQFFRLALMPNYEMRRSTVGIGLDQAYQVGVQAWLGYSGP